MKLVLTLLLSVLLYSAKAQLSVSGGYIRRTEGGKFSFPEHFGTNSPTTNNIYNFFHLQTIYQINPYLEITGKVGFSLFNESDYYSIKENSWGGIWNGFNFVQRKYSALINYSAMNLGLGVNHILYVPKKPDKAFKTSTTIGLMVQAEILLSFKESNHHSTYYKEKNDILGPDPGTTILANTASDTTFTSLNKTPFFLNFGVSFNQRFIFKSTYFIELKISFSLTNRQRFATTGHPDTKWSSDSSITNFPDDLRAKLPVTETGIGLGYILPVKKKKTP
jgi:hypothetical protein